MKAKSIATIVLLGFVGVSVAYLIIQESASDPAPPSESGQTDSTTAKAADPGDAEPTLGEAHQQASHKLVAYYFHRTQRCRTCLTIEAYAEEALAEAFPEALESEELQWQAVNLDELANEHFVEDYQLTSSALVLVSRRDGEQEQWRNLDRVWELVDDELRFKAYVEAEAAAFLEQDS
jgi:hypothetical protein